MKYILYLTGLLLLVGLLTGCAQKTVDPTPVSCRILSYQATAPSGATQSYQYEYDSQGRRTRYVCPGTFDTRYSYSADGLLITEAYSTSSGYTSTSEYTLDARKRVMQESFIGSTTNVRYTYTYDADGYLLREEYTIYDKTGKPTGPAYSQSYFYKDGNLDQTSDSQGRGQAFSYTTDSFVPFTGGLNYGKPNRLRYASVQYSYAATPSGTSPAKRTYTYVLDSNSYSINNTTTTTYVNGTSDKSSTSNPVYQCP
ncbi:hypothetical protein [Fibrella forsythiae]|uniref:YD repeat-containing protein n=1 Tax=Fibrella forsythiae TaxID=2817061 RepID=A0ABS3JG44_9BACT|nr:hypothetical protein [Fibrella forsythiae]MBO0948986.1 hypothetical protein [Fibrella forsythiae]